VTIPQRHAFDLQWAEQRVACPITQAIELLKMKAVRLAAISSRRGYHHSIRQ